MNPANLDLKKTVHLPQTGFPMKANLAQLEPKLLEHWEKTGIYDRIRGARSGRPTYILHDGPPYANGNIHLGHAFNKILKDFIVRLKTEPPTHLILEVKGYDELKEVKAAAAHRWIKAVNADLKYGRWHYAMVSKPTDVSKCIGDAAAAPLG